MGIFFLCSIKCQSMFLKQNNLSTDLTFNNSTIEIMQVNTRVEKTAKTFGPFFSYL